MHYLNTLVMGDIDMPLITHSFSLPSVWSWPWLKGELVSQFNSLVPAFMSICKVNLSDIYSANTLFYTAG